MASRFQRRFPGFSLRPRRLFWEFAVGVPVVALAALNTGNNALYLLLAMALGIFVASGLVSRYTLAHLRVHMRVRSEAFAGSPLRLWVDIENLSRWLPAGGLVCRAASNPGAVLVPTVPPRGSASVAVTVIPAHRGHHPLPEVRAEVRLPLGFFVKSIAASSEGELLVYPRRFPGAAPRWGSTDVAATEEVPGSATRGGELHQLREFRSGDDVRDIHWKQTARQQRLVVIERRQSMMASRYLILDRELPPGDEDDLRARFEDLVSEVATAALERLRRGEFVGLVVGHKVIAPAGGGEHIHRVLRELALVEPSSQGEDPLPEHARRGAIYRLAEA